MAAAYPAGLEVGTTLVAVGRSTDDGSELWVTVHPSYLLRLRDEAKGEQERMFQADLRAVARRLAELGSG